MARAIKLDEVAPIIQAVDCGERMGGECFAWAIAIHRVLLPKGQIVLALNDPIWKHSTRVIGHAAVRYRGRYWDGEGETDWDRIESWGTLDPDDTQYAKLAGMSPKKWASSDAFAETAMYVVSPKELLKYLGEYEEERAEEVTFCLRMEATSR